MRRNGRVTIAIGLERFTGICLREDKTVLDGGRTVAGTSVATITDIGATATVDPATVAIATVFGIRQQPSRLVPLSVAR